MPPLYQAVDCHTHLDFPDFDHDRQAVVDRADSADVTGLVIAGADPAHWDRVVAVADAIGAARCLGVHPWWVADRGPEQLALDLEDLANRRDLDGIGETGLDWFRAKEEGADRAAQRQSFAAHIELAHTLGLPLVMHVVRAHLEALGMLAALDVPVCGGMIHGWSGQPEHVQPALDLGLHLSFGTDITRSEAAEASLRLVPDDRLLLETDCPDRPVPSERPGNRGEPGDLCSLADFAARIRDTTPEHVLAVSGDNARRLFPRLEFDEE